MKLEQQSHQEIQIRQWKIQKMKRQETEQLSHQKLLNKRWDCQEMSNQSSLKRWIVEHIGQLCVQNALKKDKQPARVIGMSK